jgi:hypothetical protein
MMTYAVEGGGSKDYAHTKRMLYGAPDQAHALLDKLARTCATYLEAQVAAGADCVQLFDSWGGIVSPGDFREYPLRYAKRVIEMLREVPGVPIIYFVNGCAPYLDATMRARRRRARRRLAVGNRQRGAPAGWRRLQGNSIYGALFAPPAPDPRARVADILARWRGRAHLQPRPWRPAGISIPSTSARWSPAVRERQCRRQRGRVPSEARRARRSGASARRCDRGSARARGGGRGEDRGGGGRHPAGSPRPGAGRGGGDRRARARATDPAPAA